MSAQRLNQWDNHRASDQLAGAVDMFTMKRWPAEWEPQQCCFVGWPDHPEEWGDAFEPAREAAAALAIALGDEAVVCVARSAIASVRDRIGAAARVMRLSYGDIWLRDTGPVWLSGESLIAVGFRWTDWGGSYLLEGDDGVAAALANANGASLEESPVAAEGGGLETDGAGTCITTRDCLLNENRNPDLEAPDIERELAARLGVKRTIWLERGLAGDHTDGHVDNLARFVRRGLVAIAASDDSDPNHEVHLEIESTLAAAGLETVALPSPGAIRNASGELMPASYLNFVIANNVVCVPTFARETDAQALSILGDLFATRRVCGVESRALLYGGGALHCMSNNLPKEATIPQPPST